jgi:hypothetical protein
MQKFLVESKNTLAETGKDITKINDFLQKLENYIKTLTGNTGEYQDSKTECRIPNIIYEKKTDKLKEEKPIIKLAHLFDQVKEILNACMPCELDINPTKKETTDTKFNKYINEATKKMTINSLLNYFDEIISSNDSKIKNITYTNNIRIDYDAITREILKESDEIKKSNLEIFIPKSLQIIPDIEKNNRINENRKEYRVKAVSLEVYKDKVLNKIPINRKNELPECVLSDISNNGVSFFLIS